MDGCMDGWIDRYFTLEGGCLEKWTTELDLMTSASLDVVLHAVPGLTRSRVLPGKGLV